MKREPLGKADRAAWAVFRRPILGIPKRMDMLARLRLAEKRIVKYQRRAWLAQLLVWPMIIVGAVAAVGALGWSLRSRSPSGRHEMPDLPGAHEAGGGSTGNGRASAV